MFSIRHFLEPLINAGAKKPRFYTTGFLLKVLTDKTVTNIYCCVGSFILGGISYWEGPGSTGNQVNLVMGWKVAPPNLIDSPSPDCTVRKFFVRKIDHEFVLIWGITIKHV